MHLKHQYVSVSHYDAMKRNEKGLLHICRLTVMRFINSALSFPDLMHVNYLEN